MTTTQLTLLDLHKQSIALDGTFVLDEWMKDLRRTNSPDTVDSYSQSLDLFQQHLDRSLLEVDPATIQAWLDDLSTRNSYNTLVIRFYGLKHFYAWLAKRLARGFDPTKLVEVPRSQVAPKASNRTPLTDEQLLSMLDACSNTFAGIRTRCILTLCIFTAARQIELYRANFEDLTMINGSMVLSVQQKGRTHKQHRKKIPIAAQSALETWLTYRAPGNGALFTNRSGSLRRITRETLHSNLKDLMLQVGITDRAPHALRNSAAVIARREGADMLQVQRLLGHSSLDQTAHYLRELDHLEEAAEDLITLRKEK